MRNLLLIMLLTTPCFSALAEVKEVSPIKVIVDTERGVVLREPTRLDYEYAISDQKQADKDKPLFQRIFGKKCHKKG